MMRPHMLPHAETLKIQDRTGDFLRPRFRTEAGEGDH